VPGNIFASTMLRDGSFGPAAPVTELNDAAANAIQPHLRMDGRELVFSSNRSGTLGGQDVWISTRDSVQDPWSTPINLGAAVNTPAAETRPSLSWDARALLFGRAPGPEGMSDIYITSRDRITGPGG
jgi:Tol biopolymer transport system component